MTPVERKKILENAAVPEHSVVFMSSMSGGEPFLVGPYLFIFAQDWLLAVGYPLEGESSAEGFSRALDKALRRTRAAECWAISPKLPERLLAHRCNCDHYYILSTDSRVPSRLSRLADRAAALLEVEKNKQFTSAHRRLWGEFMGRVVLPPDVRELYARTETVLADVKGLYLLNAWDKDGHLAASLLLDKEPDRFESYLLGAHSREHYTPNASDLLFREMIQEAKRGGKSYLHLGLGVNDGIRRFKVKWGGRPGQTYEMAHWHEKTAFREGVGGLVKMLAAMPREPISKEKFFAGLPRQRRFAMLWEIEKNSRRSWIGGTAHFFSFSFEFSLRKCFEKAESVLFEGPLDPVSLNRVSRAGRELQPQSPRLIDFLNEEEVDDLERAVCGPRGFWADLFGYRAPNPPDIRYYLTHTRHWMAFFSLWTCYLARKGWKQSVDLEAWQLAHDMGKNVCTLETIEEQIETLENMPIQRIIHFLRQCRQWNRYIKHNERAYLKGDIDGMCGTTAEFPTRTERVIQHRDAIFLERMEPFLEKGQSAVMVGTAHLANLLQMLAEAGFSVRKHR